MKIFGWMHQKLCLGTADYRRVVHWNYPDVVVVDEGRKKNNSSTAFATHEKERDTEALLLHNMLLTIGTFGHSTPQPDQEKQQQQQQQQEQQVQEEEQEEEEDPAKQEEEEEEAANFAVVKPTASIPHSSTQEISKIHESDEKKLKQEVTMIEDKAISREPLLKEDKEKSTEKRTTLADLFAADQEATPNDKSASTKHATCLTKDVLMKKIKKTESESLQASKKIHRLITRMLKKKVHPDLARGGQERHAGRGAAGGAVGGQRGDFCLPRGS